MYLIGYDIGSSSIKAAIVAAKNGKTIATANFPNSEMDIISTKSDFAEQNPKLWWTYICESTKAVLAKANIKISEIKAIGIAYQMHGLVCVDENKKVIRNAIIWCDSRAVNIGNKAFNAIGKKNV